MLSECSSTSSKQYSTRLRLSYLSQPELINKCNQVQLFSWLACQSQGNSKLCLWTHKISKDKIPPDFDNSYCWTVSVHQSPRSSAKTNSLGLLTSRLSHVLVRVPVYWPWHAPAKVKWGGYFGVLTRMWIFLHITVHRTTNSEKPQVKIWFAFFERNCVELIHSFIPLLSLCMQTEPVQLQLTGVLFLF